MKESSIIQALRFVISAIAGYFGMHYFEIDGFVLIFYFFGIYIAVSIIIEIIRKFFASKQSKSKNY